MAKKVLYIKIARIDQNGDDLTNVLESLTQITIPLTVSGNKVYKILTRADFNTYYLFQVDLDDSPDAATFPTTTETTLNYAFTGSLSDEATGSAFVIGQIPIVSAQGGQVTTDFYNSVEQRVEINTMPKKDIHVNIGTTAAGSPFAVTVNPGSGFADSASVELFKVDQAFTNFTQLTSNSIITRGMGATLISRDVSIPKASITPGDIIFLGVKETGSSTSLRGAAVSITADGGSKFTGKLFLTSSADQGSTLLNIAEPFLTRKFVNSDCDILINNADSYRSNPFLQDIDFGDGIIPTNNASIVAGTAQKGTVPESYYTSKNQIDPRYNGVKVQSSDFNVFTPNAGTSSFGEPINIGNYGQTPSVDVNDVNLYEFDWGGGTSPEVLGCGAFKLGKILQVSSPNQVKTINKSDGAKLPSVLSPYNFSTLANAQNYNKFIITVPNKPDEIIYPPIVDINDNFYIEVSKSITDYTHILETNVPIGTIISPVMYPNSTAGSNPTIPSSTRVLSNNWSVPSISNFMGTSSNATFYGWILGNDSYYTNRNSFIFFHRNSPFSRVTKNSNGYYTPGARVKPNFLTLTNQINESLRNGGRWYISLYNELEAPTGNEDFNSALISSSILTPMNDGVTSPSYDDEVEFLASKGVYQIIGSIDDFQNQMTFLKTSYNFQGSYNLGGVNALQTQTGPGPYTQTEISGSALGFLIWEATEVNQGEFIIVEDNVTGGVGAGAFSTQFVPESIIENFESITREYGNNTN